MYKIPPRGRFGSIANTKPRQLHFTVLCDMGLPCTTSNNSKSIKERNVMLAVLKR